MNIKRKLLLSPLIIIVLIVLAGVGMAGAAILIGTTRQGETNSQSVDLQRGLIGWWDMNGNARDSTPYGNHGTVTAATLTTDRKGQTNKAYSFDAVTTYIEVAHNATLNPTTAVSVSVWIYPAGVGGSNRGNIIAKAQTFGTTGGYTMWYRDDLNQIYWGADGSGIGTAATITTGSWYHIVGTIASDGSGILYVNGAVSGTPGAAGLPSGITTTRPLRIGAFSTGTDKIFNGKIEDVRVYNRVLLSAEVTALYQEYDPGIVISDLQKGLVGNWDMNGNAKDKTMYANNGTVTGATLTTDRKGQVNKAYNFDGSGDNISLSPSNLPAVAISVAAWVQLNTHKNWSNLVKNNWTSEGDWLLYGDVSYWAWGMRSPGTTQKVVQVAHGSTTAWTLLVGTYDGTTQRLYVNGVEVGTPLTHTVTLSKTALAIGENSTSSPDGKMDDVRVYNRALSATEITALYQEYDPGIRVSDLQKGLVGNWDMNGNAKDKTMYANNGVVTGATLTTDRKGQLNKAYNFDGVNDYIDMGDPAALQLTNNLTISLWVKLNSTQVGAQFADPISHGHTATNGWVFQFDHTVGALGTAVLMSNNGTGLYNLNFGYNLFDNQWHHLVAVKSSDPAIGMELYRNGVRVANNATYTNSMVLAAGGNFMIGKDSLAVREAKGSIDDVRIYNRALTAAEVQALYESY